VPLPFPNQFYEHKPTQKIKSFYPLRFDMSTNKELNRVGLSYLFELPMLVGTGLRGGEI